MFYAVCTQCAFLRAFSERARGSHALASCPACGGELIVQRKSARFQTAYVGKVALDLHAAPPLGAPEAGGAHDA
jgi:predicted RNA-binding Zn-ribbon protein involved in translation (DUF1610 family)